MEEVKIEEINKELKRLTDNLAVMEQSLEASHSSVKLAEETLQKHKEGFKIKMNEKHQELLDAQAAAKKAQEELDRLVQENKEIDDAVFGKSIFAQAEITSIFQTTYQAVFYFLRLQRQCRFHPPRRQHGPAV